MASFWPTDALRTGSHVTLVYGATMVICLHAEDDLASASLYPIPGQPRKGQL